MKVGMFQAPFVGPERSAPEVFDWAVRQAIVADELGFSEYWIGEHATLAWESIPSPELVIAAAARQTKQINFGPLAHLLPYYHPSTLAIQTAWLSQILEGRYMMGVATGGYPNDAKLRGITDMSINHDMMIEAIGIMERVWKAEPFSFEGKYWSAGFPEDNPADPLRDMRPYGGKMQMMMTALQKDSPSIKFAAANGHLPASIFAGNASLQSHFELYSKVATENGRESDRSMHRVVRDVFIADTDVEARRRAIEGGMGRSWAGYIKPIYQRFGVLPGLLHDPSMNPADVDGEYLADNVWLVGSPDTVTQKIQQWFHELGGGFGTLLIYSHDYMDDPKPWEESMRRLATEVAPRIG